MPIRGGTIINIAGTTPVDDPFFRYKMPAVYGKIERKGKKTAIPNITDVGSSLYRAPDEVIKFFGYELGCRTTYDYSKGKAYAALDGAHMDATLQKLIHKYIEIFVLCPNCGLPETDYKIKNKCIWHNCGACGARTMVNMGHKLCNYILAQNKKGKQKHNCRSGLLGEEETNHDMNKYSAVSADIDDNAALELAIDGTREFLKDSPNASDDEIVEVVTNQQVASAIKTHFKIHILARAAITTNFFKKKEIEKYAWAFSSITNRNMIIERHLIASLELLCIEKPMNLPVMIKQCYDEDILQEETILEWAAAGRSEYTLEELDEPTRTALRSAAEPVVAWLKETESETDSGCD